MISIHYGMKGPEECVDGVGIPHPLIALVMRAA